MYRRTGSNSEVLLVHPGGPYCRKKDEGDWSVPKGDWMKERTPKLLRAENSWERSSMMQCNI